MTWIKIVSPEQMDADLQSAVQETLSLYPEEYAIPVHLPDNDTGAGIVMSHSLIPQALRHFFSGYGHLLSPELPLSRRQHEMIAATVSSLNDCFY
jgi:hypothetical protein